MKVIFNELTSIPIKSWCPDIESSALQQAINLSNLPFTFKHIALMPDAHIGYGMPIGGVMATKNVIVPNAVGVDIGCGMCAIKSNWKVDDITIDILKKIMNNIRHAIPVGKNHHKEDQDEKYLPELISIRKLDSSIIVREYSSILRQIGTLGGGNHFLEFQKDKDNFFWIMIHSGSRNLGKQVCDYYNKIAKDLNAKWHSTVDKKVDLAFLPLDSEEGKNYFRDMQYCVDFAFCNRKLMMTRVQDILQNFFEKIEFDDMINIAHNYCRLEHHFGENVLVHRKGATSARLGEVGIIPGSQGTCSYIVHGLGNKESFESCSHGAGRVMGRKEAQRKLNLEDEIKKMNDLGIIHGVRNIKDLEEASSAYKDINMVMENQKDCVEIIEKLTPIAVIKG